MNKISKFVKARLVIGFASLLFTSLVSQSFFESNPQDCELISVIKKKKSKL
jgi:hypothetical protein